MKINGVRFNFQMVFRIYFFISLDPSYSDGDQLDGSELQQVPSILFNKYALDREESRRSKFSESFCLFLTSINSIKLTGMLIIFNLHLL